MSFQQQKTGAGAPQLSASMFLNPSENISGLPDNMVRPEQFINNLLPNNIKSFGNQQKYFPLRNHRIVNRLPDMMPRYYPLGENLYEYQHVKPSLRVPLKQGAKFI